MPLDHGQCTGKTIPTHITTSMVHQVPFSTMLEYQILTCTYFINNWETLVKDNYESPQQRPGVGYFNSLPGKHLTGAV
jgi:hypothetical protein